MAFVAHSHDAATFAAIAGLSLAGGIAQLALTGALRLALVALVMPMIIRRAMGEHSGLLHSIRRRRTGRLGAPIVMAAGVILWREHG